MILAALECAFWLWALHRPTRHGVEQLDWAGRMLAEWRPIARA